MYGDPCVQDRADCLELGGDAFLYRPVALPVELRTHRLSKAVPHFLPRKLFLIAAPELLCTPIDVGDTPLSIDGVSGVADPFEDLNNLPLVKPTRVILVTVIG